jgi:Holliday junction resolvase RusA-like endonuclease
MGATARGAVVDATKPAQRRAGVRKGDGGRRTPPTAVGTLPEPYRLGPFVLPDRALCGNGRANPYARTRLVKAARDAAKLALANYAGPRFFTGRVAVQIQVERNPHWSARRLDDDNLIRGCKPLFDALADVGVVSNDRQLFVAGKVEWLKPAMPGAVWLMVWQEA